jgi:mannose-6-phosphate isomerase-like protein (cupin superfamily)
VAQLITAPTVLLAEGSPTKTIAEFVGHLTTGTGTVSIAVMDSPSGWSEPGQQPEFDEYSIVLEGQLAATTIDGDILVEAGQALHIPAGGSGTPRRAPRAPGTCPCAFRPSLPRPCTAIADEPVP